MFEFFLKSYRSGILTFSGVEVKTKFDPNGEEAKFCFRKYDNGEFGYEIPISRHNNILRGVIIGKKSWGLWMKQWSQGIGQWLFTKEEIVEEFTKRGIEIPDPLMKDFDNTIHKYRLIEYDKEIERVKELMNEYGAMV